MYPYIRKIKLAHKQIDHRLLSQTECLPSVSLHAFTPLAYISIMKLVKISMLSRFCLPILNKNRILFIVPHISLYIYRIISLYSGNS